MIVVYDVTNGDTFKSIKKWLHEIDQNCDNVSRILGEFMRAAQHLSTGWPVFTAGVDDCHTPCTTDRHTCTPVHALVPPLAPPTVGNKDDDPEKKVVPLEEAQRFAEQIGIPLYETSAKEDKNVEEVSVCGHGKVGVVAPYTHTHLPRRCSTLSHSWSSSKSVKLNHKRPPVPETRL